MKSLRHRLPSLTSLMAFEAAARTMNFTRAAEELHVSQAAISKQIRALEEHLGFEIFERQGRRVLLTHRGQRLHEKVSASFNYLADAVEEMSIHREQCSVTLSANTALSHYWLNNAIAGFRRQHPEFPATIRIITSDRTADLFADEVDIALAYDAPKRLNWAKQELFAEELYPVASLQYLREHARTIGDIEDLLSHTLLDYERLEPNWINWPVWFEALGVGARKVKALALGNSYITLVDAAARGQGVTLGTRYLLDHELESGRLTRLSSFSVSSGRSYYLMVNNARPYQHETEQMLAWLKHYAAGGVTPLIA